MTELKLSHKFEIDYLIEYPNDFQILEMRRKDLTDSDGLKIAKIIRSSNELEEIYICNNKFTEITFRAIAEALETNTSLKVIYLYGHVVDRQATSKYFRHALKVNPNRPYRSLWRLFDPSINDYSTLVREL